MGLVFRAGGTTGGDDIVAQLLNRFMSIPVNGALVIIEAVILVLVGLRVWLDVGDQGAQGIAREHEGWITVESELGHGSSFKVHLPKHDLRGSVGDGT